MKDHSIISWAGRTAGMLALACAWLPAQAYAQEEGPSYASVQGILDGKCVSCHSGAEAAAGLRVDSWDALMRGSEHGEAVIAFDDARSRLMRLVTERAGGAHPTEAGAAALTSGQIETLRDWIRRGARGPSGKVPFADARNLLYAANQGAARVSVIDMDANVVIRTVDLQALGFSANAKPHHVVVEPDGSFWYLTLIGDNRILKFDRSNELVAEAEFEVPGLLALHPTEDLLYVGRSMAAVSPPQRVGVIRRSDMSIDEVDVFFPRPHAIAFEPGGRQAYTASLGLNQFATLDTETDEVELTTLAGRPHAFVQFAVSPDGRTVVAATQLTGKILIFDRASDGTLGEPVSVDVGEQPWHPIFGVDGRSVYVANKEANSVTVVDVPAREVSAVIEGVGLAQPHGSALSPDGRTLYISSNNLRGEYTARHDFGEGERPGTVVVIDLESGDIIKVLEVGPYASGLGARTGR